MTDRFDSKKRSQIMSRIKGKDTLPEKTVRRILHRMGYRFRLHVKDLPGKPDIVLPKHNKIIFVHGCFWHGHRGCKRAARPESNSEFWNRKIDSNIKRDEKNLKALRSMGWDVLIIWQCQMENKEKLRRKISEFMEKGARRK